LGLGCLPRALDFSTAPKAHEKAPKAHEKAPKAHETAPKAHETAPKAHETAPKAHKKVARGKCARSALGPWEPKQERGAPEGRKNAVSLFLKRR
jgi:hypothetical protein